ncbi:MAG TPA: anthrone oxygenase family protein [Burkholderiales bacterium]|nr:anthrone oxygenase family protein [Burkholderiales bacterium]
MEQLLFALALLAILGCGLIAGVFFAFSSFVMKALARLPAREGIAAMQSINVVVLKSWFIAAFIGTAAVCVLALIYAFFRIHEPRGMFLLVGSVLYLVGSFLVTIVFNVPRNGALATVSTGDPTSASLWSGYVTSWTAWNHVRTVASIAAAASFGIALVC